MRTIIAGSRPKYWVVNFDYIDAINKAVAESGFLITEVVSGMAQGIDLESVNWARGVGLPWKEFPVTKHDWDTLGRKAGNLRNVKMGDYAEALVSVWDGTSHGTKHMIDYARSRGLKTHVYIPPF